MKIIATAVFCFVLMLLGTQDHAQSAKIVLDQTRFDPKISNVGIHIVGEIKKGDFDKFQNVLQKCRAQGYSVLSVNLSCPGGDVVEAMRIGTLIRNSFIQTSAPLDLGRTFWCFPLPTEESGENACDCTSACFLIWAAGVRRLGDVLGIHRPFFSKEYFQGLSASDAQKKYAMLAKVVRDYLKDMDIPEDVINKMFETASDEITYLDKRTVSAMMKVPFFDEWIRASCEPLTVEESRDMVPLFRKEIDGGKLSKSEQVYLNYLSEKQEKFANCFQARLKKAQFGDDPNSMPPRFRVKDQPTGGKDVQVFERDETRTEHGESKQRHEKGSQK